MDEDALRVVVLAYLVQVLQLASGALSLIDVPEDITLRQLQVLETMVHDLEVGTAALLQMRGVSWGAMARQQGVTRQSLHRRLSRRLADYLYRPKSRSRRAA